MIRTHIPARPRNKKIVPTGGSSIAPIVSSGGSSHSHNNKPVIDQLTQGNIDVLSYLSLYQTGVEMEVLLDEFGQPVLDINGDPVTEQIPVYAIRSTATFFSEKEVSAYGLGEEGGGGGGGEGVIETVYGYGNLGQTFNNSILTDTFNAYTINSIHERVQVLEDGGGGGGSDVEWGTLTNGYRQLTVEGVTYALAQNTHKHLWADITDKPSTFTPSVHSHGWSEITDKPSTFTPSAHTHSAGDITSGTFSIARIPTGTTGTTVALGNHLHTGVYEPVFTKNTAFNKNFGTTAGTVAEGNHTHTFASLSSKPTTLSGYGITDAVTLNTAQTIEARKTFSAGLNLGLSQSIQGTDGWAGVWNVDDLLWRFGSGEADSIANIRSERVGVGTDSPSYKLDVSGTGRFTGAVTVNTLNISSTALEAHIAFSRPSPNYISTPLNGGISFVTNGGSMSSSDSVLILSPTGNIGVGKGFTNNTTDITAQLHVRGNILATGATTTSKVIFNSAGWSMEQVGSELQMKHNNLIAARFLSDGSIVGLGEITAYGASTGGEGVALLRTGGTMTGNLTMSADIIMNSGRAIGVSNLPLKLLGNALTYNASNVLTEANTATQIKMGNGWTIEQTTSALTIKKNGVVKGTFNA